MRIRIVYVSVRNHPLYPPGRMISFRVENDADMAALRAVGIQAVCRWSSTNPGIAAGVCKVTGPIEITAGELARHFHNGTKTIDVAAGTLCTTVDAEKNNKNLARIEVNTEIDSFCTRMKITPDQLIETINVRGQRGE